MKKIILILIMIALVSSMALFGVACQATEAEATETEATEAEATEAEATEAEATEAEATDSVVAGETYDFIVAMHSFPHPFWNVMEKGAMDAAERYGVNVQVIMFEENPTMEQYVNKLNELRALAPDGIVITVQDPQAEDEAVRALIDDGIAVVCANSADTRPLNERIPYLFYVGADMYTDGYRLAQEVLKVKTPEKVGVSVANIGIIQNDTRRAGFVAAMEEAGVPCLDPVEVTHDPTTILERLKAYFTANPDIDVYYSCTHTPQTSVAFDYFEEAGLTDILTVTHDFDENTVDDIKSGKLLATTDQQQYLQGYLSVEWLYLYKEYGFLPGDDIATGPFIANIDNIDKCVEGIDGGWR